MKQAITENERGRVRELARESGFELCGFAPVELTELDRDRYRSFVAEGRHGTMGWFEQRLHLRLNPADLLPGARSALVLGARYGDPAYEPLAREARVLVSRYAVGRDYHRILRKRGARLLREIGAFVPGLTGRVVVDSAPVPEKALARAAGIAWQGKHTNMIHPKLGSYFFIVVILLSLPTESDATLPDRCGECRLCIDACPTGALEPYRIDARRCISYLTIETTAPVARELEGKLNRWVFGCDICQEVCPYNQPIRTVPERAVGWPEFHVRASIAQFMRTGHVPGQATNEPVQANLFEGSALGRAGPKRLQANSDRILRSSVRPGDEGSE